MNMPINYDINSHILQLIDDSATHLDIQSEVAASSHVMSKTFLAWIRVQTL